MIAVGDVVPLNTNVDPKVALNWKLILVVPPVLLRHVKSITVLISPFVPMTPAGMVAVWIVVSTTELSIFTAVPLLASVKGSEPAPVSVIVPLPVTGLPDTPRPVVPPETPTLVTVPAPPLPALAILI